MQQSRSSVSNHSTNQYFFELKFLKLNIQDTSEKPLRITLFKGLQKLGQTKLFTPSQPTVDLEEININLSFYIPEFDRKVSTQYKIVLENPQLTTELGSFNLSASAFIVSLVKDNTNSFYRKDKFGEDYELQYILFVEKTKQDLNQSIRSYEEQNPQSKFDTEPNLTKSISNYEAVRMMSVGEISRRASVFNEPSLGKRQPRKINESIENIEQNLNISAASIVPTQLRAQDKEELVIRGRQYNPGSMQTKLILISLVAAIGIIVYFMVVIDTNNKQLSYLKDRLADLMALNL